jgi:hypothetical protein
MWPSSLTLSLERARPSFVLDVPLLLSAAGLILALRLTRATRVWLPRTLWNVLDDHRLDEAGPSGGSRSGADEVAVDAFDEVVRSWNEARVTLNLTGCENLFWAHDCEDESVLPKGGEGGLVDRIDALTAGLEHRRRQHATTPLPELAPHDHAADVLALAAVLWRARPVVLTQLDGEEPELATYARACAVGCARLQHARPLRFQRDSVTSILAESGALDLVCGNGMRLAALHLVVPRAPLAAGVAVEGEGLDDELAWNEPADAASLVAWWNHARAFWYELP